LRADPRRPRQRSAPLRRAWPSRLRLVG
jgi:hypothetical protein